MTVSPLCRLGRVGPIAAPCDVAPGASAEQRGRQTPARGRELTFLMQLLNAQAGGDTTPVQDVNPGGGGLP